MKNQKPIEVDAHFKYRCPKSGCGFDHWLSLKETQTKNFKIVCDCGCVFKPKQIAKLKISYAKTKPKDKPKALSQQVAPVVEKPKIPVDLESNCVILLTGYGFTKEEALDLVRKSFDEHPVTNGGLLVKYILQNLGELNVSN